MNTHLIQSRSTGPFNHIEPGSHSVRSQYRETIQNTSMNLKRAGSPEFAKELTDDLTVSHTDENYEQYTDENQDGTATYRGPGFQETLGQDQPFTLKSRVVKNQNRTFADSVLNHHASQLKANGDLKGNAITKRTAKSRYAASSINDKTDDSNPYENDLERDDGRPSNAISNNDLDDQISDLDQLLTQTQMSNNLMKIGARNADFTRSHITTNDQNQMSRRTNMFKKMDDAESLSFTPDKGPLDGADFADSNAESQNWFGQKSQFNPPMKNINDRSDNSSNFANQINPVNRLKAKIKEQNMKQKGPLSKALRDQELEKALDFPYQGPVTLADVEQDEGVDQVYQNIIGDDGVNEMLQAQVAALSKQASSLLKENQRLTAELERLEKKPVEVKPQPSNELIRARALDAARAEIRELQETVETQRQEMERLLAGRHQQDDVNSRQREAVQGQLKSLEIQLEKQKIIIGSHKRDMEAAQKSASDATLGAEAEVVRVKDECEAKVKQYTSKISLLEKTLKQYETEYNQKADELDENLLMMEQKDNSFKDLEKRFIDQQNELKSQKQKILQLESDLDQISQKKKDLNNLNAESTLTAARQQVSNFDTELQSLKQLHAKEVSKLREDLSKQKDFCNQVRLKCASLQEELLAQQDSEKAEALFLQKFCDRLEIPTQDQDLESVVLYVREIAEANKLFENELSQAAANLEALTRSNTDLSHRLQQTQNQLHAKLCEPVDSQFSMQKILQKDSEISGLQERIQVLESQISTMKQASLSQDDKIWDLEAEVKIARSQFQQQANELKETKAQLTESACQSSSLLIKAVLALDVKSDVPKTAEADEQSALAHLQTYQRQVILQTMQESKKSMMLEQDVSNLRKAAQDHQVEIDFQVNENQRIRDLLNRVERGAKPQCEDQETQCNLHLLLQPTSIAAIQTEASPATLFKCTQTSLDLDKLLQENKSQAMQIATMQEENQILQQKVDKAVKNDETIPERDDKSKLTQSQMKRDIEAFKSSFQAELKDKTEQLDQAYSEIEAERVALQNELQKRTSEFEAKLRSERSEFEQQMAAQKEEYEQREFELNSKLISAEQPFNVSKMTKDLAKLQVTLRDRDRELKRMKDDLDKAKKAHADQITQIQEANEETVKEKVEECEKKYKAAKEKGIEKAVEKVRVDLRNQIDLLKNEFAKAKAEWQRERKKLVSDHEEVLQTQQQEAEQARDNELKLTKERIEKLWKKRLEERESSLEEQIEDVQKELKNVKDSHKDELRRQQVAFEDIIQQASNTTGSKPEVDVSKVRQELCEQLTKDFNAELSKANTKHQEEVSSLREDFERQLKQERLLSMPRQQEPITPQNMTVDSTIIRMQSPAQTRQELLKQSKMLSHGETSYSCMCSDVYQRRQEETDQYIEQLKQNFEKELNRQESLFEDKQKHQTMVATKLMERLVLLECDKILHLIQFKQSQSTTKPLTMNDVNRSRNDINSVIKDILTQSAAMKPSFDKIKGKLSEVLASLKTQIEAKYEKQKHEEQVARDRAQQLKSIETIQVSETNLITDRPRLASLGFATLANESVDYPQGCECHGNYRCKNCLSSPKFKYGQGKPSFPADTVVQSRDFISGYLKPEQQKSQQDDYSRIMDDEVIRGSIQVDGDDDKSRAQMLLNRLAPNKVNAKGAIVVEVEKVVRDLLMLHRTIKSAKFYRVLVGAVYIQGFDIENDAILNEQDQDRVVNTYRELLNHFFKVIVKLNTATDELTQNNEVYKLKLLNIDLKQQITDLKQDSQGMVTRQRVDEILSYFQKLQSRYDITQVTKETLEALECLQFQISKHQFKLNQLADLFCLDGSVNKDVEAVEMRCQEFNAQGGENFLESTINVRKSHNMQWADNKHNISAEMLSPDETANLIANIMQKMQKPNLNQTQQVVSLPDVSMITDNNPVTPQELLRQALVLCQHQSQSTTTNNILHSLSPHSQLYTHQQSTFSNFTTQPSQQYPNRPKINSQMPLQMMGGLPPKRSGQVTKSYNESIQRSRSLSNNSRKNLMQQTQNFVTLPHKSLDSNSPHQSYILPSQHQLQSIDCQSQTLGQNPFNSIESNTIQKGFQTGASQLRPPNPKRRLDIPGTISSSAAKLRYAKNNMPLQPDKKDRYSQDETSWLNNN